MNILFLTQVLPWPLDAGPKTRAYFVLRSLAERHQVTLLSFVRSTDTLHALDHLHSFCADVQTVPMVRSKLRDAAFLARSLLGATPFVIARDSVPLMKERIRSLCQAQQFDVVHADQLWMAPYAELARTASQTPPALVLDQHNATYRIFERLAEGESNPLRRILFALEARKLARFEVESCRRFDRVVWVTAEDVAEMGRAARAGPIPNSGVIPICIDAQAEAPIARADAGKRITFLGGLHYPPNAQGILWFAREIMPRVLEVAPDAVLTVIGKQPPADLHACGIPDANLDVTGFVADPTPWLAETAVFLVPLLAGGGMRVKILDGWRWGLPMVSTTVGAEGISFRPGKELLIADTPADFAAAVLRLLASPSEAAELGTAGRRWVEEHYHWRTVYQRWIELYANLERGAA